MNQLNLLKLGFLCLAFGIGFGYWLRVLLAKKRRSGLEAEIQKKVAQTKAEVEELLIKAREKAAKIIAETQQENDERRRELINTERILLKREHFLDERISQLEKREAEFEEKVEKVKAFKEELEKLRKETEEKIEKIAGLSKKEAQDELFRRISEESNKEILERIQKIGQEGREKYEKRAKEIIVDAIQRYSVSQAQETTTSTVSLPNEEIKGRIIGKDGRNIRSFEKLTGVELIVDESPDTVIISGFNPLRRHIAKIALEKLIADGRIQPARIEEIVAATQKEVEENIKEAGEKAVYEASVVGLHPKLKELLGRLYFRTSYGQNALLHSIEVSLLAGNLAYEVGADAELAKKAGLLHDIGKALDQEIEGSHVDIGIKLLEKFGEDKKVIDAMKAHHEEYKPESIEAVLVKVADAISASRPGARKDTLESYQKRLKELEDIALSFQGVETAYAIQAGREIRIFVKPEKINDLEAYKLAKDIAKRIEEELTYPGEIKVNVIRETRVLEYAK